MYNRSGFPSSSAMMSGVLNPPSAALGGGAGSSGGNSAAPVGGLGGISITDAKSGAGGSNSSARGGYEAYEAHSDCDSEGNDPPVGEFINPLTVDETAPPPKAAVQESRLPLSQAAQQRRVREAFEPPITYEDWVEGDDAGVAVGRLAAGNTKRDVKRLEDDSDFPLGRPYAYHAFCPTCSRTYYPVVPSGWKCLRCNGPVWQQPTDPDSKQCAVCHRDVAKNRKIFHMKIQNPLALNPHVCKRCGRIVCDQCYSPVPVPIDEYGYKEPQKVCTTCTKDMEALTHCPADYDLGTLHDEHALLEIEDEAYMLPYWPPKCITCSVSASKPPRKWECEMCHGPMWQPENVADSATCWICTAPNPRSRCHRCGQLSCKPCGAYAQVLPELGFTNGVAVSVCKACYTGISTCVVPERYEHMVREELEPRTFHARCAQCKSPQPMPPPKQWIPNCHRNARCWEVEATVCSLCTTPINDATAQHCCNCGHAVCLPCSQYRCPLPERGYPADEAQTICRACFHPKAAMMPDHCDTRQWPPCCTICLRVYDTPPPRWRCVNECGNVWQPIGHIASLTCHGCGGRVGQPVNCRRCGRIVCTTCGKNRTELVDLGFTRGQDFPTCTKCIDWVASQKMGAEERAKEERERAETERQRRLAAPAGIPMSRPPPPGVAQAVPPQGASIGGMPGPKAPPSGAMGGPKAPPPGAVQGGPPKGPPPGWKGPPPGFKAPPPGFKGPPPGWKGPPGGFPGKAPPPGVVAKMPPASP